MVETMATPRFVRSLHRGPHRVGLRVYVSLRGGKIAVPGQICQRVRVHVGGPTRQAGVPERVEVKRFELGERHRLAMLFPQAGLLDVAGPGWSGKHPVLGMQSSSHRE
jgi:hypothetical protein